MIDVLQKRQVRRLEKLLVMDRSNLVCVNQVKANLTDDIGFAQFRRFLWSIEIEVKSGLELETGELLYLRAMKYYGW